MSDAALSDLIERLTEKRDRLRATAHDAVGAVLRISVQLADARRELDKRARDAADEERQR